MENNGAAIHEVSEAWLKDIKALEAAQGWEEHTDDPCKVWKLDWQDRQVTKAETVYKVPFDKVVEYMNDPLLMKRMSSQVEKAEILQNNGDERVVFIRMEGGGPVSSREVVAVNTFRRESDKKVYIGSKSIDFPCKHADPDAVRAHLHVGGFTLEPVAEGTRIVSFNDIDMKGMIPDFIKNSMAKKRAGNIVELEEKIKKNQK